MGAGQWSRPNLIRPGPTFPPVRSARAVVASQTPRSHLARPVLGVHRGRPVVSPGSLSFGQMLGIYNQNSVTAAQSAAIIQAHPGGSGFAFPYYMDFVSGATRSTIASGAAAIASEAVTAGAKLVAPFNLVPDNTGADQVSLAQVATGSMDATATTFGNSLVSGGCHDAIIRIGWEMNQGWPPWGMGATSNGVVNTPAAYVSAVQHIYGVFKAVSGNAFTVCTYNVAVQQTADSSVSLWPGAAYTDMVGADIYDQVNPPSNYPSYATAWSAILAGAGSSYYNGLTYLANLASANGLPTGIFEWGLGYNAYAPTAGGLSNDDAYFVNQTAAWAVANNCKLVTVWGPMGGSEYNPMLCNVPENAPNADAAIAANLSLT